MKEISGELEDASGGRDFIQKESEQALIQLSANKFNVIAKYLLTSFKEFMSRFEGSSEEGQLKIVSALNPLLSLLHSCFESQWNSILKQYREVENVESLDKADQMNLKKKEVFSLFSFSFFLFFLCVLAPSLIHIFFFSFSPGIIKPSST